jgi:hypothetical protein
MVSTTRSWPHLEGGQEVLQELKTWPVVTEVSSASTVS